MTLRGALFDFDGTIFQTEVLHQRIMRDIFEEFTGQPVDEDELRAHVGTPYRDRVTHMLATRGVDDDAVVERLMERAGELYDARTELHRVVVPGVEEFLRHVREREVRTAVVSSGRHAYIDENLQAANLRTLFDAIVGRDDVTVRKPHPEPYETALQQLGLHAKECVAFEDSPTGVESAYLAGITVVGVLTTFHAEDLTKATKLIRDFRGLTIIDLNAIL